MAPIVPQNGAVHTAGGGLGTGIGRFQALLLAALLLFGAPARAAPTPGLHQGTLRHDGRIRHYLLYMPRQHGPGKLPLVVVLHGALGTPAMVMGRTGFDRLAARHGFIALFPAGSGFRPDRDLTWNAGGCCGWARANHIDDVGFIARLLDRLEATYPVDPKRVYVTGFSNGAMLAYRLACELPGRIAAIAPVAGVLDSGRCPAGPPVSVLHIHGTDDGLVAFNGGIGRDSPLPQARPSVAQSLAVMRWRDHCDKRPRRAVQGALHLTRYRCADHTAVELIAVQGGGHAWPGAPLGYNRAPTDENFNASATIWRFFERFTPRR